MPEKQLTSADTRAFLGISQNTLDRWTRSGRLPVVRMPGGHRRWREYDLHAVRAGRPIPTRDADGNVVAESAARPDETAVDGPTTPGGD